LIIATWASVFNPQTKTKRSVDDWLKEWQLTPGNKKPSQELYFDFIMQSSDWSVFDDANEYLQRYQMLSKFGIQSYGNVYDDLPNKWVEVLHIIDAEIYNAGECKRKLNKNG